MSAPLPQGTVIPAGNGRSYELRELLGQGGFGQVYRARLNGASGFSRQVAVKVLRPDIVNNQEFGGRFRDEARLLGMLRHRAIVHVDDLIAMGDTWALVMEYIPGADLSALLSLGAIPPRPTCEIVVEVCAALRLAHAAVDPDTRLPLGLVHRDIKPANLRLTPSGEIKVLDFGVARARFSGREALTGSFSFGSVGYLAPERLEGIDLPAADIYALGVVFYECLAGRGLGQLPIDSHRHREKVVAALDGLRDRFQPRARFGLLAVLEAMLSYEPTRRPTASELEETLMELVAASGGPWLVRWSTDAFGRLGAVRGVLPGGPRDSKATPRAVCDDQPTVPEPQRAPDSPQETEWVAVVATPAQTETGGPAPQASTQRPPNRRWPTVLAGAGALAAACLSLGVAGTALLWSASPQRDASADAAPPKPEPDTLTPEPVPTGQTAQSPEPPAPSPTEETGPQTDAPVKPAAPTQRAGTPTAARPVVPTGRIQIQVADGQLSMARVTSENGAWRGEPGAVPAGRYRVSVSFQSGSTIEIAELIVVEAGQTSTLLCSQTAESCRRA